jgi:hypothetical protein
MGNCFGFGALFDAGELMAPEAFKGFGPFVKGANGISIGAVEHVAAIAADVDQADVLEDAEVFGNGGLFEAESTHDITDGAFIESEKRENVAAAGFSDSIEGVGGCGGARHGKTIHSHIGICQAKRLASCKTLQNK